VNCLTFKGCFSEDTGRNGGKNLGELTTISEYQCQTKCQETDKCEFCLQNITVSMHINEYKCNNCRKQSWIRVWTKILLALNETLKQVLILTYSSKMPNELVKDFQLAHIPTFSLSFE